MPGTEPVVAEDHLHLAVAALRQSGADHILSHLLPHEPHLVEHIRVLCGLMRDDLGAMPLSEQQARRIAGDFESLAAVVAFALRLGYAVRYPAGSDDFAANPDRPDPTLN